MASRIEGDVQYTGNVRFDGTMILPANTIGDADVDSSDPLAHTKVDHQRAKTYGQSGTMAAATIPLACVYGATGMVLSVKAGSVALCTGNAKATIDVKKNGTTILTGTFDLDSGNTAYVAEAGTLVASPTLAAGDVLTAVVTVDAGTGALGTGLFVTVVWWEDPA